jgi:hypothetical protein
MYALSWIFPKDEHAEYWDNREVRSGMIPKSQMTKRISENGSLNLLVCMEDTGIAGSQPC